mgnify:CR=1 FL=1
MNELELRGETYYLNGQKLKWVKSVKTEKTSEKVSEVTLVLNAIVQGKDVD